MKKTCGDFPFEKQRAVFNDIAKSMYKGIPGVIRIRGKAHSNAAVVMAMTHGCEPGGLAAAHALLNDTEVQDKLRGDVYVTVNNIIAGTKYFNAETLDERKKHRFYQHDMNRVPEDIGDRERGDAQPYEINRIIELMPLLQDASLGLDVHSLGQAGDPMVIDTKGNTSDLDKLNGAIDVKRRITNIVAHQNGISLNCLVGGLKQGGGNKLDRLNYNVPALALEVGPHEEPSTMDFARKLVLSALMASGYLEGKHVERAVEKELYRTIGAVRFPFMAYEFVKTHGEFGFIAKDEVLATGDGAPIVAEQDCHTLFGISESGRRVTDPKQLGGERMFLAARPEIQQIQLQEPVFED